ncbi:MAG: hypothetical protein KUG73_11100 [Pseudomonadales bacterium]|nr:hypothetical protein [Pseudomonadales bacterium]
MDEIQKAIADAFLGQVSKAYLTFSDDMWSAKDDEQAIDAAETKYETSLSHAKKVRTRAIMLSV